MTARYIAIDWGSTNLRAWLYQGDHCLESRQSEAGVTRLALSGRPLPGEQAIRSRRHAPERKISGCGVSRSHDRLA